MKIPLRYRVCARLLVSDRAYTLGLLFLSFFGSISLLCYWGFVRYYLSVDLDGKIIAVFALLVISFLMTMAVTLLFSVIIMAVQSVIVAFFDLQYNVKAGRAFTYLWLKRSKVIQHPPRKRTINYVGSNGHRRLVRVQFPWTTFVVYGGKLYVFWSQQKWNTIEEAIEKLRRVGGSHHNHHSDGHVCLGGAQATVQNYWLTAFHGLPYFEEDSFPRWGNVVFDQKFRRI